MVGCDKHTNDEVLSLSLSLAVSVPPLPLPLPFCLLCLFSGHKSMSGLSPETFGCFSNYHWGTTNFSDVFNGKGGVLCR